MTKYDREAAKEYDWPAVAAGLHRIGRAPTAEEIEAADRKYAPWRFACEHEWVEDESGEEPPFDFCISCGERRY